MKDKAIIYNRKSTDRDDRQQNSLETQLSNSFDTLEKYGLDILGAPIIESVSAKTEFKRSGFERMISQCKKGGIDYIIADEAKRLSRNNLDSSRIIDLMDKQLIKGVLVTGREYLTSNPRDKFLLQLDLSLGKMDNEERGIDVKNKMFTALNRGQWLGKTIYGYRNITIKKGHKDVKYIEAEADIVRQAFIMRSEGKGLSEIARFMSEKSSEKWNAERVSKMLKNTKYYGLQKFSGQEALLGSPGYKPCISKELFEKANQIYKLRDYKKHDDIPRYFVGIIKDEEGNNLYPDKKKGKYIYYRNGSKTKYSANISQKILFDFIGNSINKYNFPKPFINLAKATLKDYYQDKIKNREVELRETSKKLTQIEVILESLIEKYLSNDIDKETYEIQKEKYNEQKRDLEEKYKAIKQGDENIIKVIEDLCELFESLSETYRNGDDEKKGKIVKSLQCELILTKQKELILKENKLLESIRLFNVQFWYSHGESNSGSRNENPVS